MDIQKINIDKVAAAIEADSQHTRAYFQRHDIRWATEDIVIVQGTKRQGCRRRVRLFRLALRSVEYLSGGAAIGYFAIRDWSKP